MWSYDKRLQFPVKIKNPNPQLAKIVISQLGGPDGDTANTAILWSIRLPMTLTCVFVGGSLSLAGLQIQTITNNALTSPYTLGITDIGTEELAHMEMISSILYQLTRNLTPEQIREGGFDAYFVDHTTGIYPQSAAGIPWSAATFQSKGDPITDLFEDMAADGTTI